MRHQEYSVKATIDAVSTPYLVSHESDYFYSRTFSFSTIIFIFSFLAHKNPKSKSFTKAKRSQIGSAKSLLFSRFPGLAVPQKCILLSIWMLLSGLRVTARAPSPMATTANSARHVAF